MKSANRFFTLLIIPGVVTALCITTPSVVKVMAQRRPILVFNKIKPKPTYWEWGKKYWPTKPVRGGYFRRTATRYVGLMNPNHWPVNDWLLINSIYEGITNTDGSYRMKNNPWLCESIQYRAPNIIDMHLEKGVKYHDGTPFNAKNYKYMYDWMRDKKNGCWSRGVMSRFKKVEVIDNYTLRWHTYDPWPSLPSGFMSFAISAKALKGDVALRESQKLSKKLKNTKKKLARFERKGKTAKAEKMKKKVKELEKQVLEAEGFAKGHTNTDQYPVGTGQFMFEKAAPGNYVKLKRNPNWWFGKKIGKPEMPYFDGMKVIVIPDPSIQLANLKAGKIDVMGLSKEQYRMIKDDPNFRVYSNPVYHTQMLAFNQAEGPCKDLLVRKAVSHAIDRKALVHGTQFGLGIIASCVFSKNHWAHNPKLKPVSYDPELSRRLLARAGYKKGLTLKGYAGNDPAAVTIVEAVRNMLSKVGINWKVDHLEPAAAMDSLKNRKYELAHQPIGFIQDPDSIPTFFYFPDGSWNYGRNNNKKAVAFFMKARKTLRESKRQKHYYNVEKALYDNYEDVWLWWEIGARAYRKCVYGFNHKMYQKDMNAFSASHPLWFRNGHP